MDDRSRQNLKGLVSTLHSKTADWDTEAKSWRPPRFTTMTHFLPDGQISEVEYHHPDGSVYRVGNYYDDAGNSKNRGAAAITTRKPAACTITMTPAV
jgi:hypothetical protein